MPKTTAKLQSIPAKRGAAAKTSTKRTPAHELPATDREVRKARLASTLDLRNLNNSERSFLATCQRIFRRDFGCVTPFEQFFWCLVLRVENGMWPTPDDVARELEVFRDDFDDMDKWARVFVKSYPARAESVATSGETRKEEAHA